MAQADAGTGRGRLTDLGWAVANLVSSLQRRYLGEVKDSDVLGRLARLRQSLNSAPGATPEVWEDTLALIPETPVSDSITPRERAVCIAVGLFAFHQQGKAVPAHVSGISMGAAARRLASDPDDQAAVRRRLQAVALAETEQGIERHVRSLISQLKTADPLIAIDYGQLTEDLVALYRGGSRAESVRLRWGRDFVNRPKVDSSSTPESSHS